MSLSTFAWSFVHVSLPFYIQRVSPLDDPSTLRWTGWIVGITSIVTVVTAPAWGKAATQWSPKTLYIWVELLQGAGFFVMAMARTLTELFLARAVLGVMGAASTFAFILAGRAGGDVRRQVSIIQSSMTVAQVVGPLAGAVTATRIGFHQSFLVGGFLLWGCAFLVWRRVVDHQGAPAAAGRSRPASVQELASVCLIVLAGSCQIFFLPAILPQLLPLLGVSPDRTLEVGGVIIFLSGAAAALGSMAAPHLAELMGDRRAVVWFLAGSSLLLLSLSLASGAWSLGALRFLQVLCIAPVFPLSVAGIIHRASGQAIGVLNSARIAAGFIGPVLATTLLATGPPSLVYLVMAATGLGALPLVWSGRGRGRAAAEGDRS